MNTNTETKNCTTRGECAPTTNVLVPRCDIYENAGSVHLVAEMPGVDDKSIDVTVERNVLTISGRFEAPARAGFKPVWREFESGEYRRSFRLSATADTSAIRASIKNGVLEVEVPQVVPAQRKIAVEAR